MSMSSPESQLLRALAAAAKAAAPLLPGVGQTVANIAAAALKLGAEFANHDDAVLEIERVIATDPVLKQMRDDWAEEIQATFKD